MFFPTILSLLGYLRKGAAASGGDRKGEREVKLRSINYAEFVRRGDPNPKTFPHISSKLVTAFRRTGALFARKFGKGSITWQQWLHAVSSASDNESPDGPQSSSSGSSGSGRSNDEGTDDSSAVDCSRSEQRGQSRAADVNFHKDKVEDSSSHHNHCGESRKRSHSGRIDCDIDNCGSSRKGLPIRDPDDKD